MSVEIFNFVDLCSGVGIVSSTTTWTHTSQWCHCCHFLC